MFARPSFHEDGLIHAFHMEIVWDRDAGALMVKEVAGGKKVPPQFGKVYIPRASMHVFILSNEQGWLKTVILSQIDVYKRMKGIMLTMGHAFANVYTPVAMPVDHEQVRQDRLDMVGKIDPQLAHVRGVQSGPAGGRAEPIRQVDSPEADLTRLTTRGHRWHKAEQRGEPAPTPTPPILQHPLFRCAEASARTSGRRSERRKSSPIGKLMQTPANSEAGSGKGE